MIPTCEAQEHRKMKEEERQKMEAEEVRKFHEQAAAQARGSGFVNTHISMDLNGSDVICTKLPCRNRNPYLRDLANYSIYNDIVNKHLKLHSELHKGITFASSRLCDPYILIVQCDTYIYIS